MGDQMDLFGDFETDSHKALKQNYTKVFGQNQKLLKDARIMGDTIKDYIHTINELTEEADWYREKYNDEFQERVFDSNSLAEVNSEGMELNPKHREAIETKDTVEG